MNNNEINNIQQTLPETTQEATAAAIQPDAAQTTQYIPVMTDYTPQNQEVSMAPTYTADSFKEKEAPTDKNIKPLKGLMWCGIAIVLLAAGLLGALFGAYGKANTNLAQGNYSEAYSGFSRLGGFRDSREKAAESNYLMADEFFEENRFDDALAIFSDLSAEGYKDSAERVNETSYALGEALVEIEEYRDAFDVFSTLNYKDSAERAVDCAIMDAAQHYRDGDIDYALTILTPLKDDNETADLYFTLATLADYKNQSPDLCFAFDFLEPIFNDIAAYAADNEDAAEACNDPTFYLVRMFGAKWKNGGHFIDAKIKTDSIMISFRLPWSNPKGNRWEAVIEDEDNVMVIYDGENNLWFTIEGFTDNSELHCGSMKIIGSDGEHYVFDYVER